MTPEPEAQDQAGAPSVAADQEWLTELFSDAGRKVAELPEWALPVVTPASLPDRR